MIARTIVVDPLDYVYPQYKHMGDVGMGKGGLTLRQHYAGLALQGILACSDSRMVYARRDVPEAAVMFADELIKELEK